MKTAEGGAVVESDVRARPDNTIAEGRELANRLAGDAVSWALLADLRLNQRSKLAAKRIDPKRVPQLSAF